MESKKEYVLSKQLLRSGTSIGANVAEAQQAQSRADFVSKISIALKEANETRYWIHLIRDSEYGQEENLILDIEQIIRMLSASVTTVRSSILKKR